MVEGRGEQPEIDALRAALARQRLVAWAALGLAICALVIVAADHLGRRTFRADTVEARRVLVRDRHATVVGELTAEGEYGRPELVVGERKHGVPYVAIGAGDRMALHDAGGSVLEMWSYGFEAHGGRGYMELRGGSMVSRSPAGVYVFPDLKAQTPVPEDTARARVASQDEPAPAPTPIDDVRRVPVRAR